MVNTHFRFNMKKRLSKMVFKLCTTGPDADLSAWPPTRSCPMSAIEDFGRNLLSKHKLNDQYSAAEELDYGHQS